MMFSKTSVAREVFRLFESHERRIAKNRQSSFYYNKDIFVQMEKLDELDKTTDA